MSANIDRSLGEIISSRKTATRGRRIGRRGGAKVPTGGIVKTVTTKITTKPAGRGGKQAAGVVATTAAGPSAKGNRKIMVSGLPTDVNEQQIKDYFGNRVGPVQRVELSYGPNGISRGVATIMFRGDLAQKAVSEHNGVKVDGKPMRVEIVYDAAHLPPAAPPKSLSDRVAEPKKDKSKKEAAKKDGPKKIEREAKAAGEAKAAATKRGRNAGRPRPKKKTQEELDAEMTDYFGANQAANGAAPAAAAPAPTTAAPAAEAPAGGDTMDEVL